MSFYYQAKKRIKSNSHNSPCDEDGYHWPMGQRFKLLPNRQQRWYGKTAFEQVGGEEVILLVPDKQIDEFLLMERSS